MGLSKRRGHRIIGLRRTELGPQRPHFVGEDTGPERTVICPKQNRISRQGEGQASLPSTGQWPEGARSVASQSGTAGLGCWFHRKF